MEYEEADGRRSGEVRPTRTASLLSREIAVDAIGTNLRLSSPELRGEAEHAGLELQIPRKGGGAPFARAQAETAVVPGSA